MVGSEIVGLVPRQALDDAAVQFLRVENFRPELVIENRLAQVVAKSPAAWLPLRIPFPAPVPRRGWPHP